MFITHVHITSYNIRITITEWCQEWLHVTHLLLLPWNCPSVSHYLSEVIPLYTPVSALRSSSQSRLTSPGFHENTSKNRFGARSFRSAAPALWTSLPQSLKVDSSSASSKRQLKTHFLKILDSFPSWPSAQFFFFFFFFCLKSVFELFYLLICIPPPPPTLRHGQTVHGALLA